MMNDKSDKFVNPQFKAGILTVLKRKCNMSGGNKISGKMVSVGM